MLKTAGVIVLFALLPALVVGQSLGEVAKKEKERRKNNKDKGVEVRVIEGKEVSEAEETEALSEESEESSETIETRKDSPANSSYSRDKQETQWRGRAAEARERLKAAQENYQTLSQLHLSPGEYYTDENGRPLITSLNQLRGLVAEAKAELDQATRAMDQLKEDARRAGIPRGWVR
jgi:hypothetical protein